MPPTLARFVPIVTRLPSGQYWAGEAFMDFLLWANPCLSDSGDLTFKSAPPVPSDVWGQP